MTGIIGAMDVEVEGIAKILDNKSEKEISGVKFICGEYQGKKTVVAKCGVGKVFAALCAEAMIMEFSPDRIINIGVAGCLEPDLKIGDIIIADNVCQHDMDTSPLGDPKGLISGINMINIPADADICSMLEKSVRECGINYVTGTIASGDQFISDNESKRNITEVFGAKACEMEGAAIGQVCYVNGIPFGILRAASDGANDGAVMDYPEFTKLAARNSTNVIQKFLELI